MPSSHRLLRRPGHGAAPAAAARTRRPAPFHLLRTGLLSTGILTLAAGAHTLAGSALPAPPILAALLALTLLASVLATKIRLGLPAMTAVLGAGQVLLHEAFTGLAGSGVPPIALPTAHQHDDGAALAGALQHLTPSLGHSAAHGPLAHDPGMLFAHVVATLLTALLLARGEAALWALAAWLRPLFRIAKTPVLPVAGRALRAPFVPEPPRLPWRTLRRDRLRGPPRVVVL
ncbi:hypothetical protein [Arthrobacter sp. Y-9]|uniref:hypothetical protein n=1 Tax=Arthrobacter sp. Y-9 TaxID=3039385 RepID=UPI00241E37CC|nr:hypothetical protein [Arthrobacter sp. Y-9]WFR84552.1 hypothetical protein P9849_02580 [Arthrobacter sp. Y-9]